MGSFDYLGQTIRQIVDSKLKILSVLGQIAFFVGSIFNRPYLVDFQIHYCLLVRDVADHLHLAVDIADLIEVVVVDDEGNYQKN